MGAPISQNLTASNINFNTIPVIRIGSPKKNRHGVARTVEERCRECWTTETPEWRSGPLGSRTLCNACGLRYSKRIRKEAAARAAEYAEEQRIKALQGEEEISRMAIRFLLNNPT